MEHLWMMNGGFMEEIGGFIEDLWMILRGFVEDLWRVYGGFMDDLWMIY